MTNHGKILFFNENDGKGIIITPEKKKINFSIEGWEDFDNMPSLGLEVSFDFEGETPINLIAYTPQEGLNFEVPTEYEDIEEVFSDEDLDDYLQDINNIEDVQNLQDPEKLEEINVEDIAKITPDLDEEEKKTIDIEETIKEQAASKKQIATLLGPKLENINLTVKLSQAITQYFDTIKDMLDEKNSYNHVDGKLEYILTKRFLKTTYNNLTDIDLHVITPNIKLIYDDIKDMDKIYENFISKTRYLEHAYNEVFLACQVEYINTKNGSQYTIEKLKRLKSTEETLGALLKSKKAELEANNGEELKKLENNLRPLNGAYVDVVHMMAELDERRKYDLKLLHAFEERYRVDFQTVFKDNVKTYKTKILSILDSQAYLFDKELWKEAKKSASIKEYFKDSSINAELNTETYLKYYLDTLDAGKMTTESQKLFKLYDYLRSLHEDYILILMSSAQDVMEHEENLKRMNKSLYVKSFIDEQASLKWARNNNVKVLIIEDKLRKTKIETFLNAYQKYIFLKPEVIVLGNKPKSSPYTIHTILPKDISSTILLKKVNKILNY